MRFSALVLAALISAAAPTVAEDWPQWRGPNRDGATTGPEMIESLPADGLAPRWVTKERIPSGGRGGWASPVVADGCVYIFAHEKSKVSDDQLPKPKYPYLPPEKRGDMSAEEYEQYQANRQAEQRRRSKSYRFVETVFCFDDADGSLKWKSERSSVYTRFPQSGTPAVVGDKLYYLGAGQMARCLSLADGAELWSTRLPGEFEDEFLQSSFAVADGVACVLADRLFGLDAKTGDIIWQGDPEKTSGRYSSPVVWNAEKGARFIVNVDRKYATCVEAKSGKELWRVESHADRSTPVVVDGLLLTYGNNRKNGLRCFELLDDGAELIWIYEGAADQGASPVAVGDYVFVQGERRLACVELETGEEMWMTDLDLARPRYTSLAAANDKVFYTFGGVLCFAADARKYHELYDAKLDKERTLADTEVIRKKLNLDELERTAAGQAEAERVWRREVGDNGPLDCSSPAIANGKLYLRLKDAVVCFDLRAK